METKVRLELKPYTVISILSFMREFINDSNKNEPHFQSIHEAVNELETELAKNITNEAWDDIESTSLVNQLLGKEPPSRR